MLSTHFIGTVLYGKGKIREVVMKNIRKWWSLMLALSLVLSLTACGGASTNTDETEPKQEATANETVDSDGPETGENSGTVADVGSDLQYVQEKGSLVIGITEFEPMDYQDSSGNWIGFDADLAVAFAESLGVTPTFQLIDWDNKVFELNGKTIDVVWNGMTLTDEVRSAMECSVPYFNNAQVVVVSADNADGLDNLEAVSGLQYAVENGSAGMAQAQANGFSYTEVMDQATALLEVSSGTTDAAVIDFLMAKAMTGPGTSYENLAITVSLNSEEYGVGFRKGSDLAEKLNEFFKESYESGVMIEIAQRYNIEEALVAQ